MSINTYQKIKILVSQVPEGRITTYGSVANAIGLRSARVVGWALRNNELSKVACHRVVNREGKLAKEFSLGGWEEQRSRLEPEGVTFVTDDQVDLKLLWTDFKLPVSWEESWGAINM